MQAERRDSPPGNTGTSRPGAKTLKLLVGIAVITSIAGCSADSATGPIFIDGAVLAGATTRLTVQVGDRNRQYLLHEPLDSATAENPYPLVILLHGSSQQGSDILEFSKMDSVADSLGFVVAFPNGSGDPSDWNAGDCCGSAQRSDLDDIAFLKSVIADVSARLPIDVHRIYVGGFSDGARMSYRVACEMASQVAAVASVSGSLVTPDCAPSRAVPVIAFHGTSDPSVPYDDSAHTAFPGVPPLESAALPPAIRFWLAANNCDHVGSAQYAAKVTLSGGTGCDADVNFYSLAGGTHNWPTATGSFKISASELIAEFFLAHRLP